MFHEDILVYICTVNISKLNFWLVICLAKNFIWTTLKAIWSIFRFFAPSDSRFSNSCILAKYCPILTNHTSMESLFIQLSYLNFENMTLMTGFVFQGHICILCLFNHYNVHATSNTLCQKSQFNSTSILSNASDAYMRQKYTLHMQENNQLST